MSGLKKLFRVMSIESILLMFKSILLERGVYMIGRNSRSAYDIIESVTGLIYPLKWELPRILVGDDNGRATRRTTSSSTVQSP